MAGTDRQTLILDVQGSIAARLDAATGNLAKIGYQPFGENPASFTGTFRYTAQRIDSEAGGSSAQPSGLYYYRARMYSPTWGRILQPDSIGYVGGANLYAYTDNDPLNLTDPSGKCPFCLPILAGLAGGVAAGGSAYLSGASWTEVGASAAAGAALGATFNAAGVGELIAKSAVSATARAAIGVGSELATGALSSGGASVAGQTVAIQTGARSAYDWRGVGLSAATGAGGGLIPGAIAGTRLAIGITISESTQTVSILSSQANAAAIDVPFQILSRQATDNVSGLYISPNALKLK